PGGGRAAPHETAWTAADGLPSLSALAEVLGERVLVEFVTVSGRVLAVTVQRGRARLHELGSAQEIAREVASLRFCLRSVATRPSSRMEEMLRTVAQRLDEMLVAHTPDQPLVIVPTGELHALPWALLPSLKTRAVAVAPSTKLWYR